jgi:putative intracellular protease/amidase
MPEIAVLVYDRITALDAVGPYEVLQRWPDARLRWVAPEPGVVRTDEGKLALVADAALDDVPRPDVVVVPGGFGTDALLEDERVLGWLRRVHETSKWTTSVCTGSLLLGAAGILKGLRATTHWAQLERLADFGAEPTGERVVFQGKVVTAAGVSSGIDMALALTAREYGDELAQALQLGIEYDPQPPFDAGSPQKAPPAILEIVRKRLEAARA